jgi:hypothetical protein
VTIDALCTIPFTELYFWRTACYARYRTVQKARPNQRREHLSLAAEYSAGKCL